MTLDFFVEEKESQRLMKADKFATYSFLSESSNPQYVTSVLTTDVTYWVVRRGYSHDYNEETSLDVTGRRHGISLKSFGLRTQNVNSLNIKFRLDICENLQMNVHKHAVVELMSFIKNMRNPIKSCRCLCARHEEVWRVEVQVHSLQSQNYVEVGGKIHSPTALPPGTQIILPTVGPKSYRCICFHQVI
jgi:hypothetical protein